MDIQMSEELLGAVLLVYQRLLETLQLYSNKYSKRRFTRPQIAACLWLKEYLGLDFRALEDCLCSEPRLRQALNLAHAPDHSTLSRHWTRLKADVEVQPIGKGTLSFLVRPRQQERFATDWGLRGESA